MTGGLTDSEQSVFWLDSPEARLPFTSGHHEMSRLNATRPVAASIRTMRLGGTNPASGA
jgi:hypothetical protein